MILAVALILCAPQPLTFAAAVARAEKANGELAAARLGEPVARAGVDAAGQLANPVFSFSAGPDDPTVSAAVDVKLPIFGQRGAAIAAAETAVPVAQADLESRRIKLRAAVRRSFHALADAQTQLTLAEEAAAFAARLEKMAAERFAAGSAPQLEAEQAALARKRADQDRADRASLLIEARVGLATLLGDGGQDVAAAGAAPLSIAPEEPAVATALDKHPEVAGLEGQRLQALARADVERTNLRPLPDVSLTLERLSGSPTPYLGLRAGLSFELPILSQSRGKIREAEAQAAQSSAQARAARQRLQGEARAARARLDGASARARFASQELIPAAERVEKMARDGYQLGRAPLLSVLQAQAEVSSAKSKASSAALEAQRALADLEEAIGAAL